MVKIGLIKFKVIKMNLDWQYEQLLITLIALKSKPKRQREIYGFGHTEDEMVNDFDSYFTLRRKKLIEYGYIEKSIEEKLLVLDKFITLKSEEENEDFWEELETHQDWETIRGMAKEILKEMGKNNLDIEVNHQNEYDAEGNITMQRTESKIIEK